MALKCFNSVVVDGTKPIKFVSIDIDSCTFPTPTRQQSTCMQATNASSKMFCMSSFMVYTHTQAKFILHNQITALLLWAIKRSMQFSSKNAKDIAIKKELSAILEPSRSI